MARRLPPKHDEANANETPGGSSGAPQEVANANASTKIHHPGESSPAHPIPDGIELDAPGPPLEVKRYVVENDPPPGQPGWPILYGGVRVYLARGKVLDGSSYDLDALRRQNVRLKEI